MQVRKGSLRSVLPSCLRSLNAFAVVRSLSLRSSSLPEAMSATGAYSAAQVEVGFRARGAWEDRGHIIIATYHVTAFPALRGFNVCYDPMSRFQTFVMLITAGLLGNTYPITKSFLPRGNSRKLFSGLGPFDPSLDPLFPSAPRVYTVHVPQSLRADGLTTSSVAAHSLHDLAAAVQPMNTYIAVAYNCK